MHNAKALLAGLALALVIGGTAFAEQALPVPAPTPEALAGLTPEAALALGNAWGMNAEENKVVIYVTPKAIHFEFPDGKKTVIDLPLDRMVVSLAPYIMKTHPCKGHYPSTCRGELETQDVKLTAVTSDGRKLLEGAFTSLPNGFLDLWLPRNLDIDVTIEARGLKTTDRISTREDSDTCVTTFKLHY